MSNSKLTEEQYAALMLAVSEAKDPGTRWTRICTYPIAHRTPSAIIDREVKECSSANFSVPRQGGTHVIHPNRQE